MGPPMGIEVWVTFRSCGWADRTTRRCPRGSPRNWPLCRNEFLPGHWAALDVGGRNCGCRVDGPLNLTCDRLWVVPCRGGAVPQTICRRRAGVRFRTLG
jgi:hypothetical protein